MHKYGNAPRAPYSTFTTPAHFLPSCGSLPKYGNVWGRDASATECCRTYATGHVVGLSPAAPATETVHGHNDQYSHGGRPRVVPPYGHVMLQNRNSAARSVLVLALAAGLVGCETERSRNPLSPFIAGPIAGVTISQPTAVTPINGLLIRVGDQPIQLTFSRATSNSERPFWYEVQVSRSDTLTDVVYSADKGDASGEPVDAYELAATLDPEQTYYWRVRALDGANTGPYSATAAFEVFTPLVVDKPTPTAPVGGAVTATRQATLVVNNAPVTGPATSVAYRFEVATDPGFGRVVASMTVPAGSATTTATTGDLAWETLHYWRSRALAQGQEGEVRGPWSDTATFRTAAQPAALGVPTLVSPINGALAPANPPIFTVANGSVSGPVGPVRLFFHVATDAGFNSVVAVFETPLSAAGTTTATSPVLPFDTTLYWRVFAGDGTTVSPWTTPQSFRTPAAAVPPPSPPPPPGCCPPPNRFVIVQQVAAETGYPDSGIDVRDFTQIVAERLHQEDANWGRRINITGPLGKDTVAYRIPGETPFSIDIVAGASSANPKIHWDEHGQVGGTWIAP